MNYSKFLSKLSANRRPSPIRELSKILAISPPEMIPLSGGFPNPELFPFLKAAIEIPDMSPLIIEGSQMQTALQYQPTQGLPELVKWLEMFQAEMHRPPKKCELAVTAGSLDGLCKAIEMVMEEGDAVVMEEFIYAGVLSIIAPYTPEYIIVKTDPDGMNPDSLREALKKAKKTPKFIYINPNGGNPTGVTLSMSRRIEIYNIASEHDLLIFEDDPYYFVQFTNERIPSLLSLDTDGRVIRFDSFSKILSSGMRLGWVTGPKPLVDQIILHMQASVMNASSLSQVFAMELFKRWGVSGFMQHVLKVEAFYKHRRDVMQSAAEKHLSHLCDWNLPAGGMFFWLKVRDLPDTTDMIMKRGISKNVMFVPGKGFVVNPQQDTSSYLRASFSIAKEEDIGEAFKRLAELIHGEKQLQK